MAALTEKRSPTKPKSHKEGLMGWLKSAKRPFSRRPDRGSAPVAKKFEV